MPTDAVRPEEERISLLWARPEHASQIAGLHGSLFSDGWDAAAIEALLAHPGSIALVATGKGGPADVCGFALAQVAADEAEILTIGVRPESQRRGVAAKLVAVLGGPLGDELAVELGVAVHGSSTNGVQR